MIEVFPVDGSNLASALASLSISKVVTLVFVAVGTVTIARIGKKIVRPFFSPLRALKGPKGGYFVGSLKEIRKFDTGVWQERMIEKYGRVMVFHKLLGVSLFHLFNLNSEELHTRIS